MNKIELLYDEWTETEDDGSLWGELSEATESIDIKTIDKVGDVALKIQKEAFFGGFKTAVEIFQGIVGGANNE